MDETPGEQDSNELSQFAQKRLLKDIKNIYQDKSLKTNGIFYVHSKTNMCKGYALIIGPEDTPYQHGAYLFEIVFPENYPHSPPKFKYLTNDGVTRFHPNLYINGKVCLSILNTWSGEKWSSSVTLSHVLLNIVSILTVNAYTHEPGINFSNNSSSIEFYDKLIEYKNIYFSVLELAKSDNTYFKNEMEELHTEYKKYVRKNINKVKEIIDTLNNNKRDYLILKDKLSHTGRYIYGVSFSNIHIEHESLNQKYEDLISHDEYYRSSGNNVS